MPVQLSCLAKQGWVIALRQDAAGLLVVRRLLARRNARNFLTAPDRHANCYYPAGSYVTDTFQLSSTIRIHTTQVQER